MATDIATLGIRVDSRPVADATKDLDKLTASGKKAEGATEALKQGFDGLKGAMAALGLGVMAAQAIQMADAWKNLQGRLSLVTSGSEELASVTSRLFDVAQRTRQGFEATSDLYTNLARTTEQLGASQNQLMQVTESISQALIVSGANAASSEAALRQLGQAFASGALRGDELNSIMENTPRIARAIAEGMGITIGQLREMGKEGKLTGNAIFQALLDQKSALETEFARMPVTVGQSMTQLRNEILKFVGESDAVTGVSSAIASAVSLVAKNIGILAEAFGILIALVGVRYVAIATRFVAGQIAGAVATANATIATTAFTVAHTRLAVALNVTTAAAARTGAALLAMVGGPIGAALIAIGGAAYLLGRKALQTSADVESLTASLKSTNAMYEDSAKKAGKAAVEVNFTGEMAAGASPLMYGLGNALNLVSGEYNKVANSARFAAMEMANAAKIEAKLKVGKLEGTLQSYTDPAKGGLLGGTAISRGFGRANEAVMGSIGGQSRAEIEAGIRAGKAQEALADATLKNLQRAPESAFAEPALKPSATKPEKDKPDKKASTAKTDAQREYEQATDAAKRYSQALAIETSEIGKNEYQIREMQAQREIDAVLKVGQTKETLALAEAIRKEHMAWEDAHQGNAIKEYTKQYKDQNDQLKFEAELVGKSNAEREVMIAQREINARNAEFEKTGILLVSDEIKRETDEILKNAAARGKRQDVIQAAQDTADVMNEMANAVRDATESFGELFGTAGAGFADLLNTMFDYQANVADIQAEIERTKEEGAAGDARRAILQQELGRAQSAIYGDMLNAAKGYFKEGSTGFKIMEGAERAYRLFQFAMQAKAIVMDLLYTGSSVANSGTRAAANGTEAVSKAMASLPPPFNFIAAGAVVAFLVAMGVKMVGGGGKGASATKALTSETKAVDSYNGPRDEYGAPTSAYSVLKPGAVAVANDNGINMAPAANVGTTVVIQGDTLQIQGGADKRTVQEMEAMLRQRDANLIEEARRAVAADNAARAGRR